MNNTFAFYLQKYFLSYLTTQRQYSENTIDSYRDTFRLMIIYLNTSGYTVSSLPVVDLSASIILDFLEWLGKERKNSTATKNVRLAHLISFHQFIMITTPELSFHCSEIINIPFMKVEKKIPQYLSEIETKHLLCAPDSNSKDGLRHLAILTLLYDSGCRVQELINLNVSDLTLGKHCKIYVHGKGNKYRYIPIFKETGQILAEYITIFNLKNNDILFKNRFGKRLTRQGIAYILEKYKKVVQLAYPNELNIKISPHLLRHSKATHLVNAGVNIYHIRDFLGHTSVITTQIYLTSNPEVTRKAIEKVASKTISPTTNYYTKKEEIDLLNFLEKLI